MVGMTEEEIKQAALRKPKLTLAALVAFAAGMIADMPEPMQEHFMNELDPVFGGRDDGTTKAD